MVGAAWMEHDDVTLCEPCGVGALDVFAWTSFTAGLDVDSDEAVGSGILLSGWLDLNLVSS